MLVLVLKRELELEEQRRDTRSIFVDWYLKEMVMLVFWCWWGSGELVPPLDTCPTMRVPIAAYQHAWHVAVVRNAD